MPEIKHHFRSGKMNKDLDERLVPNGEYRDAQNIEISTSEGDDDTPSSFRIVLHFCHTSRFEGGIISNVWHLFCNGEIIRSK